MLCACCMYFLIGVGFVRGISRVVTLHLFPNKCGDLVSRPILNVFACRQDMISTGRAFSLLHCETKWLGQLLQIVPDTAVGKNNHRLFETIK